MSSVLPSPVEVGVSSQCSIGLQEAAREETARTSEAERK